MGKTENNLEPILGVIGSLHLHSVSKNLISHHCVPGAMGIAVNKMNTVRFSWGSQEVGNGQVNRKTKYFQTGTSWGGDV